MFKFVEPLYFPGGICFASSSAPHCTLSILSLVGILQETNCRRVEARFLNVDVNMTQRQRLRCSTHQIQACLRLSQPISWSRSEPQDWAGGALGVLGLGMSCLWEECCCSPRVPSRPAAQGHFQLKAVLLVHMAKRNTSSWNQVGGGGFIHTWRGGYENRSLAIPFSFSIFHQIFPDISLGDMVCAALWVLELWNRLRLIQPQDGREKTHSFPLQFLAMLKRLLIQAFY